MSQSDLGTIDPTATSGTELAAQLSAFGAAVGSSQAGTDRPAFMRTSGMWVKVLSSTNHSLMYFNGSTDIALAVINPSDGTVVVARANTAASADAVAGGGGSYVPTSRNLSTNGSIVGGGDLSADRNFYLVGDVTGSPGNSLYYGTDSSGNRGFQVIPVPPKGSPQMAIFYAGVVTVQSTPRATYTWTAPNTGKIKLLVRSGQDNINSSNQFYGVVPVVGGTIYNITVGNAPVNGGVHNDHIPSQFGPMIVDSGPGITGVISGSTYVQGGPPFNAGTLINYSLPGGVAAYDGLVVIEWIA